MIWFGKHGRKVSWNVKWYGKYEKQKIPHCRNSPKSNRKIVERSEIDSPNTYIHDHSLSSLWAGALFKCGGLRLVI